MSIYRKNAISNSLILHPYFPRNRSSNISTCLGKPKSCDFLEKSCRLIKYHGDCDDKKSLVFTETSYFKRLLDFDIKDILFTGDAAFYDFIFLGYGFEDISLKYTLQQLERVLETLGNTKTGKKGRRKTKFYILRTDKKPRNRYQDHAYGLTPVTMTSDVNNFQADNSRLISFYSNGQKHAAEENKGVIEFSSFEAVWEGAEAHFCDQESISKCNDDKCKKLHSDVQKDVVTNNAKKFRADILKEGFTKFLEKLVS